MLSDSYFGILACIVLYFILSFKFNRDVNWLMEVEKIETNIVCAFCAENIDINLRFSFLLEPIRFGRITRIKYHIFFIFLFKFQ
jgi:hypothetical protein